MVYGLMCHSVDSSQALHFAIFYTPEGNDFQKKTRQQTIMRRILEEHLFQTLNSECSDRFRKDDSDEWFAKLGETSRAFGTFGFPGLQTERPQSKNVVCSDTTEGLLRFHHFPPLFAEPKLVVWKQIDNVAYTLICEHLDNPLLANNFLTLFIAELQDHFKGKIVDEIISRPDDILVILHYLLPNGRLHFNNFDLYNHLKKQIAHALSQK